MKFSSGKRIGQSGQELAAAAVFSFALHFLALAAAVFLYVTVTPKVFVPPFYEVKLVGQSAVPAAEPPALPNPQEKAAPKQKKSHGKERKAPPKSKKGAMAEIVRSKPKPPAETKHEPTHEQPASTAGHRAGEEAPPGLKTEGVAVATAQQDFKFGWYIALVRDKIGQNWNPPPDAKEAKARVIFSINRSGWVGDVNLVADHSIGTFGFKQAAVRAIRASNPFPPLPEEFSKQSLEFSVDLMAVE